MKKAAVLGMFIMLTGLAFGQKPAIVTNNEPGWQKIGEITASFNTENESIVVMGADEFKSIRLKVTDAPIHIDRVQVFYENGEMEEVKVDNNLKAGGQTRVIDLKGSNLELKKVAFTYRTLPNHKGDRADVELHGLKTAAQSNDRDRDSDRYRDGNDKEPDENDAKEAAERRQNDTEGDLERTEEDIEDATQDANRESKEAAREAEREAQKAENEVNEETTTIGNQIDEDIANIKADLKDKILQNKLGPDNELIYIDSDDTSKYYYINSKGKKVWITKVQMKDRKVD
jgi:flagellar biosynthesis GTPase FlhF